MFANAWRLLKDSASGFIEDNALSHAAAIAYFTVFSLGPLLLIVIAIASLVFGHDQAQQAIVGQFSGLMGKSSGDALTSMVQGAGNTGTSTIATIIGVITLLITASGAFSEIQSSLNTIWKAEPKAGLSRLVRARVVSLGLVMTLGFLMVVSLVLSAGLTAFGNWLNTIFPAARLVMTVLNVVISIALLSAVFAAVYKVLPDTEISWRDVAVGAVATAILFTIGKSLIGLYIGSSQVASSYGAAGALIIILLWIYYSGLIFLLGAEFTRAYAEQHGSRQGAAKSTAVAKQGAAKDPARRPAAKPQPAAAPERVAPGVLARQAEATRRELAATWAELRGNIPPSPALGPVHAATPVAERPSWLQLAVCGIALATLPDRRPILGARRNRFRNRRTVDAHVDADGTYHAAE